jgi:hypothetical protein
MGATSWPQSDMQRFVRLSVEMNLPIIAVSIKYVYPAGCLPRQPQQTFPRGPEPQRSTGLANSRVYLAIALAYLDSLPPTNSGVLVTSRTMAFEIKRLRCSGYRNISGSLEATARQ